ncbi:MAG: OPT/YSL family transporter [Deltaproteobacteria bacterium]|nr:OPT/YSL family transporter [Deltaproteobacteria bacterium]
MSFFQEPAKTPEELDASKPLDIAPETVAEMDEEEWYARAYRKNAPQLTVRAVLIGTVLGFFLAFTNVYIGLKTGWFLGVNLTACILTFAIANTLPGKNRMSILESTCAVSTASSAGYATGFLAVTAAPAMLLLSVTQETPDGVKMRWPVMALWIFFLAALGVTLAIPMKRNMINVAKLKFPSGTAAAVTLQGLYSSGRGAMLRARALFVTAGLSALVPILKELEIKKVGVDEKTGAVLRDTILPGQSNVFDWITKILPESWTHRMLHAGPPKLHPDGRAFLLSDFQIKLDHGVALAFAGIIIGVRITAWMVIGGLFVAFVIAPGALDALWTNALGNVVGAANKPQTAWKEIGVWCGAPLLVSSGLVTFSAQWRTVGRAFTGMFGGTKKGNTAYRDGEEGEKIRPEDVEVPNRWFVSGIVFSGAGVITVAWLFFEIPPHLGLLAVAMTFVLAIVACRATGESDITPGGPFGKIMQLTYGILIPQSSTANLQTAAITASASLSSADLLNDLKCGYLLGANPRRQFIAQAAGIVTGTIATTLCYFVLVPSASVMIGSDTKAPIFPAPGAQQWKAVAEVFKYGLGNLHPMAQQGIKWGLVAGVVLALVEIFTPKQYKKWVPSPTGIGLGMVLPFFIPLSMFLGALFGTVMTSINKAWAERYLVAIAAGGIAGESIIGVIVQGLNNFVLH